MPTPGLSCSLEWLCFRSSPVWCKNPKNNEFRTKKFLNQEFLYGISSFCTLTENNCFLYGKISCFCIFLAKMAFLIQTELPERSTAVLRYEPCIQFINVSQRTLHIYWQFSAMSHAIHKIVSKRRCQSYFISRRSPHHGISKDSDLCASAHRCLHYAYTRLCFRKLSIYFVFFMTSLFFTR